MSTVGHTFLWSAHTKKSLAVLIGPHRDPIMVFIKTLKMSTLTYVLWSDVPNYFYIEEYGSK